MILSFHLLKVKMIIREISNIIQGMSFDYIYKCDRYHIAISDWKDGLYPEDFALYTNDGKKMVVFGIVMKENDDGEVHVMNCACVRNAIRENKFSTWIQKDDDCVPRWCDTEQCSSISCSECLSAAGAKTYKCPFKCEKVSCRNVVTKKRGAKNILSAITILKKPNQKSKKTSMRVINYPPDIAKIVEKIKPVYSRPRGRRPGQIEKVKPKDRVCYYKATEHSGECGETSKSWKEKNPHRKGELKWIEYPLGEGK